MDTILSIVYVMMSSSIIEGDHDEKVRTICSGNGQVLYGVTMYYGFMDDGSLIVGVALKYF